MNPDTNKLEQLRLKSLLEDERTLTHIPGAGDIDIMTLLRPDGTPIPKHWSIFTIDEVVIIKNYQFKIAYMNESTIIIEPVGPIIIGSSEIAGR